MAAKKEITAQDLLDVLHEAYKNPHQETERPPGAMKLDEILETLRELFDLHISGQAARNLIRQLKEDGKIEIVKMPNVDLMNRNIPVRAYRLKEEPDV